MTDRLIITRPDDWHVHLRDGQMLSDVVNYTARQFARAIVMPNLVPPVTTVKAGREYRDRIMAAIDPALDFTPLMTCYLTDGIDADEIERGYKEGVFTAAKLYPANATTNSASGVTSITNISSALETMQRIGMPLLIHGEVTDKHVDIFDREAVFIETILTPLVKDYPALKVVLEHITTKDAADFVMAAPDNIAATITPHHLDYSRNAMFEGGMRPHLYCLPIAKRELHRLALRKAAISGSPKFFLGTDSAPHEIGKKEAACGCAGVFNAPYALESYAKTFEAENALDKLEGFASLFGPRFYGLPVNNQKIVLERRKTPVEATLTAAGTQVVPFMAEQEIDWHFAGLA